MLNNLTQAKTSINHRNFIFYPSNAQDELGDRLKAVCERLQAFVDPFDLDVFLPHILTNLDRQLQRSLVSYIVPSGP